MRVLVIHSAAENVPARYLKCFAGADVERLPLPWTADLSQLSEKLRTAEYLVVLCPMAQAEPSAFFITGFAAGRGIPLIFTCKEKPAGFGISIHSAEDLSRYFEREKGRGGEGAREALMRMGIPVNAESMSICVTQGNTEAVRLFLDAAYSPDTRNGNGVPLVCLAAREGNAGMLAILIEAGADVNQQAADRLSSALIDAVSKKSADIARMLLDAGADLSLKSRDGQSALVIAVGSGDTANAELLLKAGAPADEKDSLGMSARKYASLFHSKEMADLFDTYAPLKEDVTA